jgi:transcriptional regulator with XRE-family HTH domain
MRARPPQSEHFVHENELCVIGRRVIRDRRFHRLTREMLVAHMRSGLSQGEIAMRMGTSQSALSRLENAAGPKPTLATLEKFAAAIDHRLEIRFIPVRDGWAAIDED